MLGSSVSRNVLGACGMLGLVFPFCLLLLVPTSILSAKQICDFSPFSSL